jgi:hypothetical protein
MTELVFLKLGGSLITDKTQPYKVRLDKLTTLAKEIHSALSSPRNLRLVLGHGSGSFGHYAVKEHAPLLLSPQFQGNWGELEGGWRGFAEVCRYAAAAFFLPKPLRLGIPKCLAHAGLDIIALHY